MLYSYGIEPDVLTTWERCKFVLTLIGFQHGRALLPYPSAKRWRQMVLSACNTNPDCKEREFKRIEATLTDAAETFLRLPPDSNYDGAVEPARECWIRNATTQQERCRPFTAILATKNPMEHDDVILYDDISDHHDKLDVPRAADVLREPEALVNHIGTLVKNSREFLWLIDPHFDPSKYQWRPVVAACLNLVHECDGALEVKIHTVDRPEKPSAEELQRRCSRHLVPLLDEPLPSVRVCLWRIREDATHDFHARYIITDRGGYRLDKGLDLEEGKAQPIVLLSNSEWLGIRNGFRGNDLSFEEAGHFYVG